MSYYNDFAFALEQQSNDLDNMLAELDSANTEIYSGALESVQNTVEGIYDIDACESLLDNLGGVMEAYNSALEQMRDAAEEYQYTGDKEAAQVAVYPASESLKGIYCNITGYAPEGSINQDMIGEIRNFLTGSKDIIEARMYELEGYGYAGESYSDEGINYDLCDAYVNMCNACEAYNDFIYYGYSEYGYAFESEASGAEKAKKEGLFARMKKAVKEFCVHMANTCRTKRDEAKNKALKGIYNSFYGIFMRLSGQADQLKEERAAEKLRKEAEKQKDELNKQVENAGGDSTSTDPEALKDERKAQKAEINRIKEEIKKARLAGDRDKVKRLETELEIASSKGKSIADKQHKAYYKQGLTDKWSDPAKKLEKEEYALGQRNGLSNEVSDYKYASSRQKNAPENIKNELAKLKSDEARLKLDARTGKIDKNSKQYKTKMKEIREGKRLIKERFGLESMLFDDNEMAVESFFSQIFS